MSSLSPVVVQNQVHFGHLNQRRFARRSSHQTSSIPATESATVAAIKVVIILNCPLVASGLVRVRLSAKLFQSVELFGTFVKANPVFFKVIRLHV